MAVNLFTPSLTVQNARQHILSRLKQTTWLQTLLPFYYRLQGNQRHLEGKGNVIQINPAGCLPALKQVAINIKGNFNTVVIESGTHLRSTNILINGSHNVIYIGAKCQIGGGCLWIEDNHSRLEIGKGTTIADATIGVAEPHASVSIGEDCMLSHGIDIRCGDSHSILDLNTHQRLNYARRIQIDDHVWIGMHSCLLKDVHVGHNAIVAAGSIVTKDIPPHSIAAGIPATVKRVGVTWTREKIPAA